MVNLCTEKKRILIEELAPTQFLIPGRCGNGSEDVTPGGDVEQVKHFLGALEGVLQPMDMQLHFSACKPHSHDQDRKP